VPALLLPALSRPPSRSYADESQRLVFAQWLAEAVKQSGISRKTLARQLWPESADAATTHQIKSYLEPKSRDGQLRVVLPAPPTLRTICRLVGAPWTEAFALAGYFRELLYALGDLANLGHHWMLEDQCETRSDTFRAVGIVKFGNRPILEAIQDARVSQRYTIGWWHEPDDSGVPCLVPKPIAAAILVVCAAFPRRGDILKDEAVDYAPSVLRNAVGLIELAEATCPVAKLPLLLDRVDRELSNNSLWIEARRPVAAEHAVIWADSECGRYTHFARLGAMERFGVVGSSVSTHALDGSRIPDFRKADLPDPKQFNLSNHLS
jgi:hypothetical protein